MDGLIMTKCIALTLSICIQLATAPGGGGGGGGGGCSSHSSSSSHYSSKDHVTLPGWAMYGILIPMAVIYALLVLWAFGLFDCKDDDADDNYTQPPTMNEWLEKDGTLKEEGMDQSGNAIFVDGKYAGRYLQDGIMHDFPPFELIFNQEESKVLGSGVEEVGQYNISGKYNPVNNRMAITQTFVLGTGNPSENLGHSVFIRLEWNANEQEFEGKWYCKTHKYASVNKFWIKPIGVHQSLEIESIDSPNYEDTMGHKYV